MELLCPECLVPMESADGQAAHCAKHGGEFQILFARTPTPAPIPAPVEPPPLILQQDAVCAHHPTFAAVATCKVCGTAICGSCDVPRFDGSHICRNCLGQEPVAQPILSQESAAPPVLRLQPIAPPIISTAIPASPFPPGVYCGQHSKVQATSKCKLCGVFMCHTCAFDLPSGAKICPACATAPPKLSSSRKKLLVVSFVTAVWSTIFWVSIYSMIGHRGVRDREGVQMLGLLILVFVPVPSLIGVALGVSTMERRAPNPMAMWIATIWNGLILAAFILVFILGIIKVATR